MQCNKETHTVIIERQDIDAYEQDTEDYYGHMNFTDWLKLKSLSDKPEDAVYEDALKNLYDADTLIISGEVERIPKEFLAGDARISPRLLSVADGVKRIDANAFDGIGTVDRAVLPDDIFIDEYAFAGSGIRYVSLGSTSGLAFFKDNEPEEEHRISIGVFEGCKDLREIELRKPIYYFGADVCHDDPLLTTIDMSNAIEIEPEAFMDCTELDISQQILPHLENIGTQAFDGAMFSDSILYTAKGADQTHKDCGYVQYNNIPDGISLKSVTEKPEHETKSVPSEFEEICLASDRMEACQDEKY